ncbi:MAG: hypothetical protein ACJAZV_000504 [Roseivirga sp.]|jgi:hypothetical protein
MKHKTIFIIALFFSTFSVSAQEFKKWQLNDVGLEMQAYPAGMMFMAKANFNLSEKNQFTTKVGYNMARRQDFGEHDNEEGGGLGANLAFKHYFKENYSGWNYSLRASLWMMTIDWSNNAPAQSGTTSITVFQPTISGGYDFALNPKLKLGIFVAFGYEINVISSGQDVGQGGISLLGFSISQKIK